MFYTVPFGILHVMLKMKYPYAFLLLVTLFACSNEEDSNKKTDEDLVSKETEEVIETPSFCDCLDTALEILKEIESDPERLEEYKDELAPCGEVFANKTVEERMKLVTECPDILEKAGSIQDFLDIGSFIEKARESSDDVDAEMRELENLQLDTLEVD